MLCVAALLASDLLRGAHLLAVHHAVCPEHGELIHAHEGAGAAPRPTADGAQIASSGAASHHHDHCDLAAPGSRAGLATFSPPLLSAIEGSVTAVLGLAERVRAPAGRAVVEYAPKQSPPARA